MPSVTVNKEKVIPVVKRIFWLVYQASNVFGMGRLQARTDATEEDVWDNLCNSGDYPVHHPGPAGAHRADYVFGKMMKLKVEHTETTITLPDNVLDIEYQSWANAYKTYGELLNKALEESGV